MSGVAKFLSRKNKYEVIYKHMHYYHCCYHYYLSVKSDNHKNMNAVSIELTMGTDDKNNILYATLR